MTATKDDLYHVGLTDDEVRKSRTEHGVNLLTPPKRPSLWKLYLEKFEDPVVRVLLVAAFFSLIISIVENEYAETIGIIAAILLATGIGFFFEYDANKKFDLLNAVNEETLIKVIRNGHVQEVPRKDVVVGDIVILETGEEIPADGELLEAVSLQINESNLTGEPVVTKTTVEADFDEEATAPAVIAVLALSVYPLFRGIYLSFLNYNLVRPNDPAFNTFAGLQNYIDIFKDKVFIQSIGNTVKWTVVNLVVQLVAAMLLALALNQKLKGRSVYRTLILVPWAVPHAIAAMTFTFLYNANVGIINILAVKLGMITESVSWLGNVGSAFWCVVLVAIWKGIPFQMIFILAALQGISGDVYESAEIDGASRWQCFWKITLPIIKEPLAISTILNLIGIVSCFNTIWLMTKGGPLYSTEIIYTYAYRRAFIDHNFGTAAAASVVLFVFMAVFSGVYLKMVSEKE